MEALLIYFIIYKKYYVEQIFFFSELLMFKCIVIMFTLLNCKTTLCANMVPIKIWQLN